MNKDGVPTGAYALQQAVEEGDGEHGVDAEFCRGKGAGDQHTACRQRQARHNPVGKNKAGEGTDDAGRRNPCHRGGGSYC